MLQSSLQITCHSITLQLLEGYWLIYILSKTAWQKNLQATNFSGKHLASEKDPPHAGRIDSPTVNTKTRNSHPCLRLQPATEIKFGFQVLVLCSARSTTASDSPSITYHDSYLRVWIILTYQFTSNKKDVLNITVKGLRIAYHIHIFEYHTSGTIITRFLKCNQ